MAVRLSKEEAEKAFRDHPTPQDTGKVHGPTRDDMPKGTDTGREYHPTRDDLPQPRGSATPGFSLADLDFSLLGQHIATGRKMVGNMPAPAWLQTGKKGKGRGGGLSVQPPGWMLFSANPPAWTGLAAPAAPKAQYRRVKVRQKQPRDNRPAWIRW